MEPNHLLAIGLGNVHRKIDHLKVNITSDFTSSFDILNNSLVTLSSIVDNKHEEIKKIIGVDTTSLLFKDELGGDSSIISALNYLNSHKVHFDLATEIENHNEHILEFKDKDKKLESSFTVEVYSRKYIDDSIDSLYTDLNRCCVNIMRCSCHDSSASIIYGDTECYCVDESCSNILTCYYLDNLNQEQPISSYGIIFDQNNKKIKDGVINTNYCIHIWHPKNEDVKSKYSDEYKNIDLVYHPIKIKKPFDADQNFQN